jgi:NAD(P)H-hydrate repair Nnr-like enzyme with NAD(P)H-hydrate epimerase domain
MPVTLYTADFVTLFQDEDGNQGSDELSVARHLFQNNYNIWESIFRDAMAKEEMEISYL